jgi:uncharacterized membrane protein
MTSLVAPDNAWPLWAFIVVGAAGSIYLEQTYKWAAKLSGPVVALLLGMTLSNFKLMPTESPSYDVVDAYLVRIAIPLLLLRANVVRILRETGPMFLAFHIAALGSVLGAFLAAFLFRGSFDLVPEVTGIMTASYVGGGVNFVAVADTYKVKAELTNPLLVADNFIMAGMFVVLLSIAASKFFRRHYPHPHSLAGDREDIRALAARYWRRKEISLLDIAKALAIAFAVAAISITVTNLLKTRVESRIVQSIFANPFVLITVLSVVITTLFHRWTENIQGAEDLGMYLLYLFFFVIGLRADFVEVVRNVPVLFLFCLVMAVTNLVFTLGVGKLFRLNLEELLLSVNATLGGPPSAAAMAISRGWSNLVLPGLLAGIWGYVIGTFVGILVAETLLKWFSNG